MQATAKQLRFQVKQFLEAIDRGEEIIITYRNKPRAKLVPYHKEKTSTAALSKPAPVFGIWKKRRDVSDVERFVDGLRRGRIA